MFDTLESEKANNDFKLLEVAQRDASLFVRKQVL